MLKRKQIRDYCETMIGALALVDDTQTGRMTDVPESGDITAFINTPSESAEYLGTDGFDYQRSLTLEVQIVAKSRGNIYDQLDPVLEQIEQAFKADPGLGVLAITTLLTGVTYQFDDDRPIAGAVLTYQIIYTDEV